MKKKKILMVHNFYQIGGGEHTVFRNEVELLRENGHEVVEYTRSNDELKTSKLKLFLMPFTTTWSWKTYWEVQAIIKKEKIDIVHCHNTFPLISPSVYYAACNLKIPVVQTIHNFRLLCPNGAFFCDGKICEECTSENRLSPAIKKNCYRGSKVQTLVLTTMLVVHRWLGTYRKINYIFLTDFNRKKFSKLIDIDSPKVFVKPNFVSSSFEGQERKEISTTFVYASRLEENKGLKYLVHQWKKLSEDYILHIYGDGPLKEYLINEIKDSNNISYLGFKPQSVIFEDLRKSMAMVFPSMWYEGFPMIIAESMAIGCPILSADIGNHGDIVRAANCGALFSFNDDESFSRALHEVIKNNNVFSLNCDRYYRNVLEKQKNYQQLNEIYQLIGRQDE